MEPKKTPIRTKDSKEALQPVVLCPTDTDDCFELANEPDEFGVHVPDHSAEK